MGPVAQLVFKTSAVVQPTARSVRLRRRSVGGTTRRSRSPAATALQRGVTFHGDGHYVGLTGEL